MELNRTQYKGYMAFKKGVTRKGKQITNPYSPVVDFDKNRDWEFGYNLAYFDNLKRISNDD